MSCGSTSFPWLIFSFFCNSAVSVHDLSAHRKMDVTRERISRILELIEMLLCFQTCFNLVNAAVVCAILMSTSGLETLIGYSLAQGLKACDCLKRLSVYWKFCVDATCVVINLAFLALIAVPKAVEALSRRSINFVACSSSPAEPSMSSTKRRLVIVLSPVLTVPS